MCFRLFSVARRTRGRPQKKLFDGRRTPPEVKHKSPRGQTNWRYTFNVNNDPDRVEQKEKIKEKKRTYMQDVRLGIRIVTPKKTDADAPKQKKPRLTLKKQVELLVKSCVIFVFPHIIIHTVDVALICLSTH